MLSNYLDRGCETLSQLIAITRQDLEAVKNAKHDGLFLNAKKKEELLQQFYTYKNSVDSHMASLISSHPNEDIKDFLSTEQISKIDEMRVNLIELKELNQELGRLVLAVGEFFNTLLSRLLPSEHDGYEGQRLRGNSFLQAEA